MKFKLVEAGKKQAYSNKKLTQSELRKLLDSSFSKSLKDAPIWRGIYTNKNYPFLVTPNPDKSRVSASAGTPSNIYTTIINNDPHWDEFPNREIICTTKKTTTIHYGETFRVYPQNGGKIGICPDADIWMEGFLDNDAKIGELFREFGLALPRPLINYSNFVETCAKLDRISASDSVKMKLIFQKMARNWRPLLPNNNKPFLDYIVENYYSPKKFKWRFVGDFDITIPREVWTDVPCILVPDNYEI